MTQVPVASLADSDMLFLDQATQVFGYNQLPYDVLSGDDTAIKNAINKYAGSAIASLGRRGHNDWMSAYKGPLLAPVQEAVQAFINAMPAPVSYWDRLFAAMGLGRKASAQKNYDHYLKH